jgi:hypothetical protein
METLSSMMNGNPTLLLLTLLLVHTYCQTKVSRGKQLYNLLIILFYVADKSTAVKANNKSVTALVLKDSNTLISGGFTDG